jgi:hypothetical protein
MRVLLSSYLRKWRKRRSFPGRKRPCGCHPQKHGEIKQAAEDGRLSMTALIMILVDKALDEAKRKK